MWFFFSDFRLVKMSIILLHKKWSFLLRISLVNVTKSGGNCGFGHIYWKNPKGKTSFLVQCTRLIGRKLLTLNKMMCTIDKIHLFCQEWWFIFLLHVRFNKKNGIGHWIKAETAVHHLFILDAVECWNGKK